MIKVSKEQKLGIIKEFVADVEKIAEENMLKTHKLEGMYYAAMKQKLKELENDN